MDKQPSHPHIIAYRGFLPVARFGRKLAHCRRCHCSHRVEYRYDSQGRVADAISRCPKEGWWVKVLLTDPKQGDS